VSYTATPEEYDACHYEGSFTLFGRHQGARYQDFASGLTRSLVGGQPAPAGAGEPPSAGFGSGPVTPPRSTPDAGQVIEQPAESVARRGQAKFRWHGGDASVDAPRAQALVSVEHRESDGSWRAIATDDGFQDITERTREDGSWTETFQFADCDPLGTYRFHVRGRADRGAGAAPYEVVSREFTVGATTLTPQPPAVSGSVAVVRATYPDPGEKTLMATPRFATTGQALVEVTQPGRRRARRVRVAADPARYGFAVSVPAGGSVRVLSVVDGCGNRG
jgi:hypothetical protein